MNTNSATFAAAIVFAASTATYAVLAEKRIHDLKNQIHRKEKVTDIWKRNFERASEFLSGPQLLSILDEMHNDSKFERITLDI